MNLACLLARTAQVFPDRPAVAVGDCALYDYREWARRAGALARSLRERFGLSPGDRVALLLGNCPQFLELLYGIWYAGAVAVPINSKLHPKEVAYILADSGASLLFTSSALAHGAAARAQAVAPPRSVRPTTSPGCSTPRERPASPRA
jgi:long-chain acyl-CoA synthetase